MESRRILRWNHGTNYYSESRRHPCFLSGSSRRISVGRLVLPWSNACHWKPAFETTCQFSPGLPSLCVWIFLRIIIQIKILLVTLKCCFIQNSFLLKATIFPASRDPELPQVMHSHSSRIFPSMSISPERQASPLSTRKSLGLNIPQHSSPVLQSVGFCIPLMADFLPAKVGSSGREGAPPWKWLFLNPAM